MTEPTVPGADSMRSLALDQAAEIERLEACAAELEEALTELVLVFVNLGDRDVYEDGEVPALAIGMVVIAAHLSWQTWRLDLTRPEVNFRLFLSNILTGALLACTAFFGIW
jgi:hypothetical protein